VEKCHVNKCTCGVHESVMHLLPVLVWKILKAMPKNISKDTTYNYHEALKL
jgi:hypothetical protein